MKGSLRVPKSNGTRVGSSEPPAVWMYQRCKSATQSGQGKKRMWVVEITDPEGLFRDPLTGWVGTHDTQNRMRFTFGSQEDAQEFADQKGWRTFLIPSSPPRTTPQSYSNNFQGNRGRL